MTGLDTNVLVRYIAQDDTVQSPVATRLIEKSCTVESPGFISLLAMAELIWVCESNYDATRAEVARIVRSLLSIKQLAVQDVESAWQALALFENSKADFADCLIERQAARAGCMKTVTFDKQAAKMGMSLLTAKP